MFESVNYLYNNRYTNDLLVRKFLNHMKLIEGFLEIYKCNYGHIVISNELIEAFVFEFVQDRREFMDDTLKDNCIIFSTEERSTIESKIIKLIDEIQEIKTNDQLIILSDLIQRLNEEFGKFKTEVFKKELSMKLKNDRMMELNHKISKKFNKEISMGMGLKEKIFMELKKEVSNFKQSIK